MSEDLPRRKQIRLANFDYGSYRKYFITICTKYRDCLFSEVTCEKELCRGGACSARIKLKPCGVIVEEQIRALPKRYNNIVIDNYVIMPNHIHIIISLLSQEDATGGASPAPTIPLIVCSLKSLVSRKCKAKYGVDQIFQRSYYDHIIRNEKEYYAIYNYIKCNPQTWQDDEMYSI